MDTVKSEFFHRVELRPLIRDRFMISGIYVSRHGAGAFVVFNRFPETTGGARVETTLPLPLCVHRLSRTLFQFRVHVGMRTPCQDQNGFRMTSVSAYFTAEIVQTAGLSVVYLREFVSFHIKNTTRCYYIR